MCNATFSEPCMVFDNAFKFDNGSEIQSDLILFIINWHVHHILNNSNLCLDNDAQILNAVFVEKNKPYFTE